MGKTHRPYTSTKFRRQSPELMRQRFLWLNQVLIDPELPASAFKVAYRISDGFNDIQRDGEAFESGKKIGIAIGMSEGTVIAMVRRLHDRGHLRVEWGQQGRGHPNKYWLVLKPQSAEVSDDEIKPQAATRKPQPAEENQDSNQVREPGVNHAPRVVASEFDLSAEPAATTAAVAIGADQETAAAAGFEAFWLVYPKQVGRRAAEREYMKALQGGATAEEINAGAQRYAADSVRIERSRDGDRYTKDPSNWLKEGRWADKPTGVTTIDECGNTVAVERPFKTTGTPDLDYVERRVLAIINGGRA